MVYASAFARGYTPETKVFDVKTQFSTACEPWDTSNETPCYSPNNYNNKFVGPISLRNALAQSLNIPAVKVLYLTGIRDAIKTTEDMGITTLNDPDRLGLTLVLGGGEVKLLEHTGAYGVFANEGVRAYQRAILKIEDSKGTLIEEFPVKEERVLDKNVALQMSDILSDNDARTPLWGANSLIRFTDRDVAAKSGSTNNSRDAWIMGYTPNLAVGVWVGNNDNAPMNGLSGLIATPMWRKFFDFALKDLPVERFAQAPATDPSLKPVLQGQLIDVQSLITNLPEGQTLDIAGLTGGMHNILHYVEKRNPRGPYPASPASDGQYRNWEYGVQNWVQGAYSALIGGAASGTPATTDEEPQNASQGQSDEDEPVIRPRNRRN
jgi:membrane peptidoglycan carboxypeptidase